MKLHPICAFALGLAFAVPANAGDVPPPDPDPFRVVSIPWVGTAPNVPHEGVNEQSHYFQAVAQGDCDGNIEFRWDFDGDGNFDTEWAVAPSRYNLGAQFTYPAQQSDRLFVARVEGRCGPEVVDDAEFPIRIRVNPTRQQRVNRAISNGLWYAFANTTRQANPDRAIWGDHVATAMLVQAMMNRGHRAGVDFEVDPYAEYVQHGLHYILSGLARRDIGVQAGDVNPDVNENGYALRPAGEENYEGGGQLEAISSWGDSDYVIPENVGPVEVAGRRLGDVVQDTAEYFMWSQSDIAFDGDFAGGWDYSVNAGVIDSSQVGWAAVGLFASEVNGEVDMPEWVKTRTFNGVRYNDASRGGDQNLFGGYGYRAFNSCGANHARSGAMLNALGFALSRNPDNERVAATVDYIARNFNGVTPDCWGGQNLGNYYAMFQVSKGMRSFVPPFEDIGDAGLDWYGVYADWLVQTQAANGSWNNDNRWMRGRLQITTALGLLVLIPTVFEAPPVAVAQAEPVLAGPGDQITFSHANSYSPDPGVSLNEYRWNFIDYPTGLDLNDDGDFDDEGEFPPEDLNEDGVIDDDEVVWEVITDDPNLRPTFSFDPDIGFGEEVTYRVVLRVRDQLDRTDIDDESVVIRISIINHPPVALPHPSGDPDQAYTVVPGRTYLLDGSASFDPDLDDEPFEGFQADEITFMAWDLNSDGDFEAEGAEVEFLVPVEWEEGQNRVLEFLVCDDGRWVGQTDEECGGDCSLCAQRSARFVVVPNAPPELVLPEAIEVSEGGRGLVDASESSDPEGGALEYTWECPEDLVFEVLEGGNAIDIDASALDAPEEGLSWTCTVTVTDDLGATDQGEVRIDVINRPPTIENVEVQSAGEGQPVVFTIDATDPAAADDESLVYSIDCESDGVLDVIESPAPVLECNYADDGRYTPTVLVEDDDGGMAVLELDPVELDNAPPVIQPVVCPPSVEGSPVVLQIVVDDAGGDADPIGCELLDPRPDSSDLNGELCVLFWTPTYGQAQSGAVDFAVQASDDEGASARVDFRCEVRYLDEDEDLLPDTWERQVGLDPTRNDCEEDPDMDGLTNCQEFDLGRDPFEFDGATPPILISPIDDALVASITPELRLQNANDALGNALSYEYTIYADAELNEEVARSDLVEETEDETAWTAPEGALEDNNRYWWTARAFNGESFGESAAPESFVVNSDDQTPTAPRILQPEAGDQVADPLPEIVINNAFDPDPDAALRYECEIAVDGEFAEVVQRLEADEGEGGTTALTPVEALAENQDYWIRCRALDGDNQGPWSEPVDFTVNRDNEAPNAPTILEPPHDSTVEMLEVTLVAGNAEDPDGDALTYRFWLSTDPTFPEEGTLASDEIAEGEEGTTSWALPEALQDNTFYFWRVRARDPSVAGPAATGRFYVNLENEPPTVPRPLNPAEDALSEPDPRFLWAESTDPENDAITYNVELFDAEDAEEAIWGASQPGTFVDYEGELEPGDYWWRVQAEDALGATSEWTARVHFIVEGGVVVEPDMGVGPEPDMGETPQPDLGVEPDMAVEPEPDMEVDPDTGGDTVDAGEADFGEIKTDADDGENLDVTGAGCECDVRADQGQAPLGLLLLGLALLGGVLRRRTSA